MPPPPKKSFPPRPGSPPAARSGAPANPSRPPLPASAPAPTPKPAAPAGPTETGWLPDCVYTGEKFEFGVAFFADALGRLSRFSREPKDLAIARRLAGQAALPGLVNTHSRAFHRLLRGRGEQRSRPGADPSAAWREAHDRVAARLSPEDVFDTARMTFMEMLTAGITCVGEFHYLHQPAEGATLADPNALAQEILRAARDVGIRIALLKVAAAHHAPSRAVTATADQFVREAEALRVFAEKNYPADDAWIGIGAYGLEAVPVDYLKAIGTYAHAQRLRLHVPVSLRPEDNEACRKETGRTPVALLASHGLIDKRFVAIGAAHLSDEEIKLLGTARATVCACPTTERNFGFATTPVEKLLAAGAGVAVGSGSQVQVDLLEDARLLEYSPRVAREQRGAAVPEGAALFHAATFTGARGLGATGGALEVGRPADFFTVNLLDPSIAGAEGALLNNIVFSLERRAVHEVWIGARQCVANGRHPNQGLIASRFVELQRRLWGSP